MKKINVKKLTIIYTIPGTITNIPTARSAEASDSMNLASGRLRSCFFVKMMIMVVRFPPIVRTVKNHLMATTTSMTCVFVYFCVMSDCLSPRSNISY